MIGIGVTTYNRPQHLELCLAQIKRYTSGDYKFHVADDTYEQKGIAFRKNECLKHLNDCDYIFLFDDDCFPIKDKWDEYFISACKISGQQHFLYLKETSTIKKISVHPNSATSEFYINSYNNCGGCFMFLTKNAIDKVGGYCKDYGLYGFEHAGYSKRIHAAGLTPLGEFLCPEGAGDYIYAMDYDYYLQHNKNLKHCPSLKIDDALNSIKFNEKIFSKDIQQIYQPL